MDYPTFLRRQWQALLDEWLGLDPRSSINTAFIALPDLSWLGRLADPRLPGGGGGWSPLPGISPAEALLRRDHAGRPQLWVRPEEKADGSGRYAAYWDRFVRHLGAGTPSSTVEGRDLAVDHLFPETAAARRGFALVRAMPVDRRSNSLVGSSIERVEAGRGGVLRPRTASSVTLAKVTGFQGSFARRHDEKGIARDLLAHIKGCGLLVPAGVLLPDEEEAALSAWLIGSYRR